MSNVRTCIHCGKVKNVSNYFNLLNHQDRVCYACKEHLIREETTMIKECARCHKVGPELKPNLDITRSILIT